MAISRVPGYSLLQDLDRVGTDLQFTTNGNTLVYMDFSSFYVGINTATPTQALEVVGNVLVANGHVYTGANLQFDIGKTTNWWRSIYAGTVNSTSISGTLLTNAQPNITSLGTINNLDVTGNLSVDGNLIVNGISVGNLSANTITANVFGNVTGYILQGDQPFITSLSNITVSNITITGGEFDFGGDVSFETLHSDFIFQNNNPVLDSTSTINITGDTPGSGTSSNVYVQLTNTGVGAGTYGADGVVTQFVVDAKGRISSASNITLTKFGNLNFSNTTISSNTDLTISTITNGNIYLNANGSGTVQFIGSDAVGLPYGDDSTRPLYPEIGYTRYNTDRQSIEYYDGNSWLAPGAATISSEVINPDGTANTYVLGSNTTVDSVLVSINGTLQQPIYSYNIVNNNQITFTETPLTSDVIEVRFIAVSATSVTSLRYGPVTAVTLDLANVNVTGNLLPSANVTYSLGSETLQWKDLWVSGNSIYIGGSALTVANGQLSIGGNTVGSAITYSNVNVKAYTESMGFTNYSNVNVAAYIPSYGGALQSSNIQTTTANIQATTSATNTATGALRVMGGVGVAGSTYTKYLIVEGEDGVDSAEIKANLTLNTYGSKIEIAPAYPRNAQLIIGSITHTTNPSITLGNPLSSGGRPNSSTINFNTGLGGTPAYIQYTNSSQDWDFTHASLDGSINFRTYSSVDDGLKLTVGGSQGNVKIYSNAQSTSSSTGALVINGGLGVAKNSYFNGNVTIQGNLFVNGNLTTINANNLSINDSMIYLADDNPADTLDIGIVSAFTSAVRYQHTGLVRDATDGVWKLFANVVAEPTTTVDFTNADYSNLRIGSLTATSSTFNGNVNVSGNVLATNVIATNLTGTLTTSSQQNITSVGTLANLSVTGNITVSSNVVFSGWSIRETGNKLYFAYNGINKMSLDTGGNLVVTGDVTAFGNIT